MHVSIPKQKPRYCLCNHDTYTFTCVEMWLVCMDVSLWAKWYVRTTTEFGSALVVCAVLFFNSLCTNLFFPLVWYNLSYISSGHMTCAWRCFHDATGGQFQFEDIEILTLIFCSCKAVRWSLSIKCGLKTKQVDGVNLELSLRTRKRF